MRRCCARPTTTCDATLRRPKPATRCSPSAWPKPSDAWTHWSHVCRSRLSERRRAVPRRELRPLWGCGGRSVSAKNTGAGERMVTLDVSLLGRDYKVACKADEQAELKDAVAFLEGRMREIRESSKTTSIERVAVMAA